MNSDVNWAVAGMFALLICAIGWSVYLQKTYFRRFAKSLGMNLVPFEELALEIPYRTSEVLEGEGHLLFAQPAEGGNRFLIHFRSEEDRPPVGEVFRVVMAGGERQVEILNARTVERDRWRKLETSNVSV